MAEPVSLGSRAADRRSEAESPKVGGREPKLERPKPESRTPRVDDRKPRAENRKSKAASRGSRIEHRNWKMENGKSRIENRNLENRESKVVNRRPRADEFKLESRKPIADPPAEATKEWTKRGCLPAGRSTTRRPPPSRSLGQGDVMVLRRGCRIGEACVPPRASPFPFLPIPSLFRSFPSRPVWLG